MTKKVLVIDDDESARKGLTTFLMSHGYEVVQAYHGEEGLQKFAQEHPEIVFVDVRMPRMDGLEFLREALEVDPNTHVMVMTAFGGEDKILKALRLGAANFFKKPLDYREVAEALHTLEARMQAEKDSSFDYSFVVEEREVIEIPNDLSVISAVVNHLTRSLPHYFDDQAVHGVQGALIEMIVNAIEHGNLEISYEEKTKALEKDKLNELIAGKAEEKRLAGRKVRITYHLTLDKVTYEIEDEGAGFDVQLLPDPGDPDNIWKGHGRGILMTRALMDEVAYSEKGNKVTLIKRIPQLDVCPGE